MDWKRKGKGKVVCLFVCVLDEGQLSNVKAEIISPVCSMQIAS
jgi:hypothetical protein